MSNVLCPRCKKVFSRKENLERHLNRKNPCIPVGDETINAVTNEVEIDPLPRNIPV